MSLNKQESGVSLHVDFCPLQTAWTTVPFIWISCRVLVCWAEIPFALFELIQTIRKKLGNVTTNQVWRVLKTSGQTIFFFFLRKLLLLPAAFHSCFSLFSFILVYILMRQGKKKKKKGKWSQRGFLQYYLPTHWHDSSYKFGYHSLEGYLCFCKTRMPKSMCSSLYFQIKTSELFFSFLRNEAAGNSPI